MSKDRTDFPMSIFNEENCGNAATLVIVLVIAAGICVVLHALMG